MVDRAVERFQRESEGLAIEADIEEWSVSGEATALERAIGNLLDNAAKWSPPGGTVWVSLSRGRLMVEDEGPGVDPRDVPFVFDRFYRAMESRGLPGSGLGLSVVQARRRAPRWHRGGQEDPAHGGAAFVIDLPDHLGSPHRRGIVAHSERSATRDTVET